MIASAPCSLRLALAAVFSALAVAAFPASAQTEFVGAWPYGPASAMAFDADQDLAFFGSGGIVVTEDVSNPATPALVSDAIQTRGVVMGLAFDATTSRLYVGAGEGGLEIWDVRVPASPRLLGSLRLKYFGVDIPANSVAVSGTTAYVAADFGFLHQVDVTDPANPVDVGFYGQGGTPSTDVFLANGFLYLGGASLVRFKIQPNGSLSLVAQNLNTSAGGVFASERYVYGVSNRVVLIFAASSLAIIGSYSFGAGACPRDVSVSGTTAYVADVTRGIHVLDVSNPTSPVEIGADPTVGTSAVQVGSGYLYATGSNRFRILDVSTPSFPVEVGSRSTEGIAYDVDVAGRYACVADNVAGLYVLDVTDPENPVRIGRADVPDTALDVALSGAYAYVACRYAGLRVFSVQDPTNPFEIGALATPDYARGVFVQGTMAYVADLTAGLRVIDVSNPAAPVELGSVALPAFSNHVFVSGNFAYVANGCAGLSVVDVSNPAAPAQVGLVASPSYAAGVFVAGTMAYVADFLGGLRVLDLSSPANPVEVGVYAPAGLTAGAVSVARGFAYVMDAADNLRVVDVSNPSSPVEVDIYDTPGSGLGVFVTETEVFVADGEAGVQIVRFVPPTERPPRRVQAKMVSGS